VSPPGVSPITNLWGSVEPVRLDAEHVTVYRGRKAHAYSHQAQLTSLNGSLYLSWSLGVQEEEEPSQIVVLATSEDRGATWSEPTPIMDVQPGRYAPWVAGSTGIRMHDGVLTAYIAEWEYDSPALDENKRLQVSNHDHHLGTRTRARTSSDGGATWSEPVDIMPRLATYLPPAPTASGRLILAGHVTYPYTDDPVGLTGWTYTGLSGLPDDFVDDTMGWDYGREARNDPRVFNEGSFFQTDDGVIHMMLRTESDRLWVTESRDDGETWSEPTMTGYTDGICRVHFGRLEDGRFFGLGTPDPTTPWSRTPAVLAMSENGVTFDRNFVVGDEPERPPRIPGSKRGRYGYPYLHVMGDTAFVAYSVAKEDISVARFPLADLA
jgi:hypothetical protein